MAICIMATGGTFDKEYNELDGTLSFKETHIKDMLSLGRSKADIIVRTIMMKDSLEMQDFDRELILSHCNNAKEKHIIITHGTDRMSETAHFLGKRNAGKDQTIVLTGAMIPYAFGSSDGLFNLGCAIGFVQTLPFGVYVAMNGRYFHWNNVRKNITLGAFEELTQTAQENNEESF
ncbi:asparaginase domain-containing protein [Candidatus Haliotispira prima]|uniref:Asparaginase domain-containing protein n=1 Tax=Candidatus Haliotispira prima TaxID=3034016 RepID=A0ABY8MG80_9SPIO|nr:asparaginase domain-containing protein [Candidatus Haliotispira prima]